jgi:translation initiation factor 5B
LLTPKQKEEQRAAENRRRALLASGVRIEGLQQKDGPSAPPTKRPIYGRKKAPGAKASPAPSAPQTPQPLASKELTPEPDAAPDPKADDVKSDWDASSGDEKQPTTVVKSDWDASSDEEEKASLAPSRCVCSLFRY